MNNNERWNRTAMAVASHLALLLVWYLFVKFGDVPPVRAFVPFDSLKCGILPRRPVNVIVHGPPAEPVTVTSEFVTDDQLFAVPGIVPAIPAIALTRAVRTVAAVAL